MPTLSPCTVVEVPTKMTDNCSYASMWKEVDDEQDSIKAKFDAFEHYSSNLNRLKTLLLSSDEDDDDLNVAMTKINNAMRSVGLSDVTAAQVSKHRDCACPSTKRRRGNHSQLIKQEQEAAIERKTRLSWELHPDLILHELYEHDKVLDENKSHPVSDDKGHEEGDPMSTER